MCNEEAVSAADRVSETHCPARTGIPPQLWNIGADLSGGGPIAGPAFRSTIITLPAFSRWPKPGERRNDLVCAGNRQGITAKNVRYGLASRRKRPFRCRRVHDPQVAKLLRSRSV